MADTDPTPTPTPSPIPTLRWRCDIARPAPRPLQIYRGETARLECLLTLQGAPAAIPSGATATLAWQSRDMGASWYTASASVDVSRGAVVADFGPANDSGAAEYRAFLRVDGGEGSGICYRAVALIQMLDSPGAVINEIPVPPRVLDFATVEVLHAPYWTKAEADARFATPADATLTPIYSDTPTFSEWAISPPADILLGYSGDPAIGWTASSSGWDDYVEVGGTQDSTSLSFAGLDGIAYTATRTRTDIEGYQLGSQSDKPLAPADAIPAVVAPSTDAAAAGKAADAKSTGDALAGKLDKSGGTMTGNLTMSNARLRLSDGNGVVKAQFADDGAMFGNEVFGYPHSRVANRFAAFDDIPPAETWTFEIDDGQGGTETVTKSVAVYTQDAQSQGGTP